MGKTMQELTEKQKETLLYIDNFIKKNGYSPSTREIGYVFNLSVRAVQLRLEALQRKGYINRPYGIARAITIIK